jgi:hypothetical protein
MTPLPFIPAHSASLRAFTPVFDGLWTRVNALLLGIQGQRLGPRFRGDERMLRGSAPHRIRDSA